MFSLFRIMSSQQDPWFRSERSDGRAHFRVDTLQPLPSNTSGCPIIGHIWGASGGKTFHLTSSFQDFPLWEKRRSKSEETFTQKFHPQPSEMRYEEVLTSRVNRTGEIPVPGLGIQPLHRVNKHGRASLLHISLKMHPASQPVNPAVTVSEQRAAFSPSATRFHNWH